MDVVQVASVEGGTGAGQPPEVEPARERPVWWVLAWLVFLPVAVLRAGTLSEGDTFWQIRGGLLTISRWAIPMTDPFSWTMHGKPWTQNSWGFDVFLGLAYRLGGLTAVGWACTGLVMTAAGLVILSARRLGASPAVASALLMLATPFLVPWLSARPQLADYIAVPVLVLLLRRIAEGRGGLWTVLAVGLLSVAWVNLHAGALLGAAITAACAGALLARRSTRRQGWLCTAAAALALAGAFANPYGFGIIAQTEHVRAASAGLIVEWQPFDVTSPSQWLLLAIGVAALVLALRRQDMACAGALAVTAAATLYALRFQPVMLLVAVPVLAAAVPQAPAVVRRYLRSRRTMFLQCGTAGMVAWAAVAAPSLTHIGRPNPADYSLPVVRAIPHGCRVFSSYLLGSFVILERPDVPVSLDSRNDLYGKPRILADARILAGHGNLARGLAGAGCVLISPGLGLDAKLRHDPTWALRASSPAAVLFTRRGAGS